jgi:hypothetical protein
MKIGGREVILNERLIVPKGESVVFDLIVEKDKFPIEISIIESANGRGNLNTNVINGKLFIEICVASVSLVTSIPKPIPFGVTEDNESYGFTFAITRAEESYLLDFLVMIG